MSVPARMHTHTHKHTREGEPSTPAAAQTPRAAGWVGTLEGKMLSVIQDSSRGPKQIETYSSVLSHISLGFSCPASLTDR